MIPYGHFFVCSKKPTPEKLSRLLTFFCRRWPESLVSFSGKGGLIPIINLTPESFSGVYEFLIYRDQDSVNSWRLHGMNMKNKEALVQAFLETGAFVFVANGEKSSSGKLVKRLIEELQVPLDPSEIEDQEKLFSKYPSLRTVNLLKGMGIKAGYCHCAHPYTSQNHVSISTRDIMELVRRARNRD